MSFLSQKTQRILSLGSEARSSPKHKQRLPIPNTITEQDLNKNGNLHLIYMSEHNSTSTNLQFGFHVHSLTVESQPHFVYKDRATTGFHVVPRAMHADPGSRERLRMRSVLEDEVRTTSHQDLSPS